MPTSIFAHEQFNSIDYLPAPTGSAVPDIFNLGLYYLGGPKAMQRRPLLDWNIYGPAISGRPITPADSIQSAEILLYIESITGGSGFDCTIERNSRADWVQAEARWDRYKSGSNWTTPGGDVATPPAAVHFTSPVTVLYEMQIAGLLEFVTDAIANRSGIVRARFMKTDEAVATSYFWTANSGLSNPNLGPRLRVQYAVSEPRPMLRPNRDGRSPLAERPSQAAEPARPERPDRRPAQPARRARPAPTV